MNKKILLPLISLLTLTSCGTKLYNLYVTYDPSKGKVTGDGTYESGTIVKLTAKPKDGYRVLWWNDDGEHRGKTLNTYRTTIERKHKSIDCVMEKHYIEFGTWPQNSEPSSFKIDTLPDANGDYTYNEERYVKVQYSKNAILLSDGTKSMQAQVRYCKYVPVSWIIVSENATTYTLLSEKCLMTTLLFDDYSDSKCKTTLNKFINLAFSDDEAEKIVKCSYKSNGDTYNSKIFIPSKAQLNDEFAMDSNDGRGQITDYMIAGYNDNAGQNRVQNGYASYIVNDFNDEGFTLITDDGSYLADISFTNYAAAIRPIIVIKK